MDPFVHLPEACQTKQNPSKSDFCGALADKLLKALQGFANGCPNAEKIAFILLYYLPSWQYKQTCCLPHLLSTHLPLLNDRQIFGLTQHS